MERAGPVTCPLCRHAATPAPPGPRVPDAYVVLRAPAARASVLGYHTVPWATLDMRLSPDGATLFPFPKSCRTLLGRPLVARACPGAPLEPRRPQRRCEKTKSLPNSLNPFPKSCRTLLGRPLVASSPQGSSPSPGPGPGAGGPGPGRGRGGPGEVRFLGPGAQMTCGPMGWYWPRPRPPGPAPGPRARPGPPGPGPRPNTIN